MTRTEKINTLIRDTEMMNEEITEVKTTLLKETERTERMRKTLAELKSRLA